ncbi:TauD/TfdA family dioxygenase [Erwinia piriflorinigrans]|uniref:Clavaminate synthase-like protein n=1 Tax=Erwinia piriflorinigrans CFBP 5888 TaxID=1161919 RepID=V5Z8D4_9GAMM|nr:TauD/TfdA family dioxygenase [Erwinia piriflorinigrans]CCG87607.1 Clavaminate synthase-like protein [Erwinia piriflorinigrans CFBP 5888]
MTSLHSLLHYYNEESFPLVIHYNKKIFQFYNDQPSAWINGINDLLLKHGAILFRGFPVSGVDAFENFVSGTSGSENWMEYPDEKATPRSAVKNKVMTSTEYHAQGSIYLHNECCHRKSWPQHLYFCCHQPAKEGGATPVASVRAVTRAIEQQFGELFRQRGARYLRNYGGQYGANLSYSFGTEDPETIESYCEAAGLSWQWLGKGQLRTLAEFPAYRTHPQTHEALWFNNITFYHRTSIEPRFARLLAHVPPEELAFASYYGDGEPIADTVIQQLRAAYDSYTTRFAWQADDVLLIDNMICAHARDPYKGARTTWVAMAREVY